MFKYIVAVLFALFAVSLAAPAPAPKPQFFAANPYAYAGYSPYVSPYVVSPYSVGYSGLSYGYGYPYTFY